MQGVYPGSVTGTSPNGNACIVKLDSPETVLPECYFAAGIFSALFGVRFSYTIPVGSRVLVAVGAGASYIIGMIPGDVPDTQTNSPGFSPTFARGDFPHLAATGRQFKAGGHTHSSDLLEGELEITNLLGISLGFLTHLAKLSAGDRAAVEVHLLNDMVRIISETYKHHSAFGDFKIYNDGGLNVRWDGTSYPHESFGQLAAKDAKIPTGENVAQFSNIDGILDTGRWRFSQFVGFLGDFINLFVTDPAEVLGKIAENNIRSGKAHLHVGNDGTVMVRSVAEISLERVVRIPVPVEKTREEDPKGDVTADFDKLNNEFLKFWKYEEGTPDWKDAWQVCYQLREYSRWLANFQSLARFHQLQKDWKVPSEAETPEPSWNNKEDDRDKASGLVRTYYDVYACIRIMRDGSIILRNGMGSSVIMAGENVSVAAARNLTLEAGNDVRIIAGQNISVVARRSITIAAIAGGLTLKSRAWLKALCEWGSIWLKSDAVDPAKSKPELPETEHEDPSPLVLEQAIRIETTRGRAAILSEQQLLLQTRGYAYKGPVGNTTGDSDNVNNTTADVVIQASGASVRTKGMRGVFLLSQIGRLVIKVGGVISIKALALHIDLVARELVIKNAAKLLGGWLQISQIKTQRCLSLFGFFGPKCASNEGGGNHIYERDPKEKPPELTTTASFIIDAVEATTKLEPAAKDPKPLAEKWKFEDDTLPPADNSSLWCESPAQEYLRRDLSPAEQKKWGVLQPARTKLQGQRDTGNNAPAFPGEKAEWLTAGDAGEPLNKPSGKKGAELAPAPATLQQRSWLFRFRRRKPLP